MTGNQPPNRCRLVLIVPQDASVEAIEKAMTGGDVASVILPQYDLGENEFQDLAGKLAPIVQNAGAALIVSGDTRVAGRVGADGIHVETNAQGAAETIARVAGKMIVGCGGIKTRHSALELGETGPDYLFFGKFGYDNKPEAHPRNLALGEWWAEMVEIPGIVMAGSDMSSIEEVARTGTDFVAASQIVFGADTDPATQVAAVNRLLDDVAPEFED